MIPQKYKNWSYDRLRKESRTARPVSSFNYHWMWVQYLFHDWHWFCLVLLIFIHRFWIEWGIEFALIVGFTLGCFEDWFAMLEELICGLRFNWRLQWRVAAVEGCKSCIVQLVKLSVWLVVSGTRQRMETFPCCRVVYAVLVLTMTHYKSNQTLRTCFD